MEYITFYTESQAIPYDIRCKWNPPSLISEILLSLGWLFHPPFSCLML